MKLDEYANLLIPAKITNRDDRRPTGHNKNDYDMIPCLNWLNKVSDDDALRHCDFDKVMDNTRPSIKKRYERAFRRLKDDRLDLNKGMATIKSFIKWEKTSEEKALEKPGRMIQYRSYEYLYLLKSFILAYGLKVKSSEAAIKGQKIKTIFTKLYDIPTQTNVIKESWDSFKNPVALCLDHSKFDGHYDRWLLQLEHSFWMRIFDRNPVLEKILRMQMHNRGFTQCGIKYKYVGKRSSGEFTTSDGNSLLNYCMLATWLESHGITDYRIHVNGDDSIVIISMDDLKKFPKDFGLGTIHFFADFNMQTELGVIAYDFREISYCQCQPIRVNREGELTWLLVKDPIRAMSRSCYCDSKFMPCINRYKAGTALCELACNAGVPILQSWSLWNLACTKFEKPLGTVDKIPASLYSKSDLKIEKISDATREDFEVAFGITKLDQLAYETSLTGNSILNTHQYTKYLQRYHNFHVR
jgi:hypothetical protein